MYGASTRGARVDHDWDDDTECHRAVGRAWVMVAIAGGCSLVVVGFVAVVVLGLNVFLFLVDALSG